MITNVQCMRRGSFIAVLLMSLSLSLSSIAGGQSTGVTDSWLQLSGIEFSDNGDLVSWRVDDLNGDSAELIEPQQSLLTLRAFQADRDISGQIRWRRLPKKPGSLGRFVGNNADFSLEIHRRYVVGLHPGTIVHEVQMKSKSDKAHLLLRMQTNLTRHAANDRSLGDVFYDNVLMFASSDNLNGPFEPVRQQRQANAAALVARHVAVVVNTLTDDGDRQTVNPETGLSMSVKKDQLVSGHRLMFGAVELREEELRKGRFHVFLYADMLSPLRYLARTIERVLQYLTTVVGNPGTAMVLFAVLVRLMLMPLSFWSIRQQRRFASIQKQMKPEITHIEENLDGPEKNENILQTYKAYGISPFSGLKGSISLFIQIPILIAVFAVTTESALFHNVPFLWLSDLSLPDRILFLPFSIPGLGAYINLLPIILGVISVLAAFVQSRSGDGGASASPRAGLILASIFVVFFYSCAAALVLYWIVANVSQIFEHQYVIRAEHGTN
jgi:YidC/Oxa1 family membrane protein insertase